MTLSKRFPKTCTKPHSCCCRNRFSFPLWPWNAGIRTEVSDSPWSCSRTRGFPSPCPWNPHGGLLSLEASVDSRIIGVMENQMLQPSKSSGCSTLPEPIPAAQGTLRPGDADQELLSASQFGSSCPGGFGVPSLECPRNNQTSHTNSLFGLCHPLVRPCVSSWGFPGAWGRQRNSRAPLGAQVTPESSCPGSFRGWVSEVSL